MQHRLAMRMRPPARGIGYAQRSGKRLRIAPLQRGRCIVAGKSGALFALRMDKPNRQMNEAIVEGVRGSLGMGEALGVRLARIADPAFAAHSLLLQAFEQAIPVTVYLVNGFQLRGMVKGFDSFTIVLEYEHKHHLIYKHAVSTISPQSPLNGSLGLDTDGEPGSR